MAEKDPKRPTGPDGSRPAKARFGETGEGIQIVRPGRGALDVKQVMADLKKGDRR